MERIDFDEFRRRTDLVKEALQGLEREELQERLNYLDAQVVLHVPADLMLRDSEREELVQAKSAFRMVWKDVVPKTKFCNPSTDRDKLISCSCDVCLQILKMDLDASVLDEPEDGQ